MGSSENLSSLGAAANRAARPLLDLLDHAKKVQKLGIRLANDPHAAQIADIALKISPGIKGKDVAGLEALVGGRPVVAPASRDQAVFKRQAPPDLLSPQPIDQLIFRMAGRTPVEHSQHRGHDTFGGLAQLRELSSCLSRSQPLQRKKGVNDLAIAEPVLQQLSAVPRKERRLNAHLADRPGQPLDMFDR